MAREHEGKQQTRTTQKQLSGISEREVLMIMIIIVLPYISFIFFFYVRAAITFENCGSCTYTTVSKFSGFQSYQEFMYPE